MRVHRRADLVTTFWITVAAIMSTCLVVITIDAWTRDD